MNTGNHILLDPLDLFVSYVGLNHLAVREGCIAKRICKRHMAW